MTRTQQKDDQFGRQATKWRVHIPELPFWCTILRIIQLVLALIILILTAFASTVFDSHFFPGYGMSWFAFAWTVIFSLYVLITPPHLPELYNCWVHIALEATLVVFYLIVFSLLASELPIWHSADNPHWRYGYTSKVSSAARASDAAVVVSVIQFILFLGSFSFFAYKVNLHRTASTSTSSYTRHIHNARVLHTPSSLSPTPNFIPVAKRPISNPVMPKPAVDLYSTRGAFERELSTQSWDRDRRMVEITVDEDDDKRTDFSPAFV